jgi:hypothetical protein
MPLAARRRRRTAAAVGGAVVVAHGINRRGDRREDRRHDRATVATIETTGARTAATVSGTKLERRIPGPGLERSHSVGCALPGCPGVSSGQRP